MEGGKKNSCLTDRDQEILYSRVKDLAGEVKKQESEPWSQRGEQESYYIDCRTAHYYPEFLAAYSFHTAREFSACLKKMWEYRETSSLNLLNASCSASVFRYCQDTPQEDKDEGKVSDFIYEF